MSSPRTIWPHLFSVTNERLAPMTPTGSVDAAAGTREFNVGTGGESTETMVAVAGQFSDTGSGTCH